MTGPAADGTVGQFEICEFVGDLFTGEPISTHGLIGTAEARGARPAVIDALRHLPHTRYQHYADLLADLAHLPASVDPWEPG